VATVELTKDTFEDVVVNNDMVLVDFWAEWCGPCRFFAPVYEKVSADYPDVVFAKVDTEAERELAAYFNIRSIPTLMIFRDKVGIFAQPGALPEEALIDLIGQAQQVDMGEVKRQIAEQDAGRTESDLFSNLESRISILIGPSARLFRRSKQSPSALLPRRSSLRRPW
jgi:thioredoxin 1